MDGQTIEAGVLWATLGALGGFAAKLVFDVLGQGNKREERLAIERQAAEAAAHAQALQSLEVLRTLTQATDKLRESVESLSQRLDAMPCVSVLPEMARRLAEGGA